MTYDVIIIGSGPAGLTAAIYSSRAKLTTLVLEGDQPGGQLMETDTIENFPGFINISGYDLIEKMKNQAIALGVTFLSRKVTQLDITKPIKEIRCNSQLLFSKAIILSTGSNHKSLNIPGEKEFHGNGVFSCYVCDGFFYQDQHVVVVGGGNTAVSACLYLSKICSKVTLIHRRDQLRAEAILVEKLLSNDKIEIQWNTIVQEIQGTEAAESVLIQCKNIQETISCDGVCICIGHDPNTQFLQGIVPLDEQGYILKDQLPEGIFAAGDCQDTIYQQAIVAAADGCKASMDCEKYLSTLG